MTNKHKAPNMRRKKTVGVNDKHEQKNVSLELHSTQGLSWSTLLLNIFY